MAALDFPASPTVGQTYVANGVTFVWDGVSWNSANSAAQSGVFYENNTTVTANYTVTTNKNAMSAGPITIDSGATVTVPDGSTWTIV
jgi:hypothetical protein